MTKLRNNRRRKASALQTRPPEAALSAKLRQKSREQNEDENAGTDALTEGTEVAEVAARHSYRAGDSRAYSTDDLSTGGQSGGRSSGRENADVSDRTRSRASRGGASSSGSVESTAGDTAESAAETASAGSSNTQSRWRQRYDIKRSYATGRSSGTAAGSGAGAGSAGSEGAAKEGGSIFSKASEKAGELGEEALQFAAEHWNILLLIAVIGVMIVLLAVLMTSCSSVGTGGGDVIFGTSYTAADDDILGAEEDYIALEEGLNQKVIEVRSQYPGYDEYHFDLDDIGHDPYQLAAILTILKEDYTREEVQELLQEIFELQYEIEVTETVETRHHSDENHTAYEWKILNITLHNRTLDHVVEELDIPADKVERYELIYELKGNRAYIFGEDIYSNPSSTLTEYQIPGEALTDEKFANMMAEAEKYLGTPYVWGGYNPSGFDCSGFVSYVINHCGNGWSYGHLTTWGLEDITTPVSRSEAQPGDLIFFEGTYATTGPSHVGIYVGNGMMLHCGNPVHYSSIETSFWQEHFRGFRRLP